MKLTVTNISDIDGFFNLINKCKGKIELITSEGDCLNLKSALSQYVSITKLFDEEDNSFDFKLNVHDDDDIVRIVDFMMKSNKK